MSQIRYASAVIATATVVAALTFDGAGQPADASATSPPAAISGIVQSVFPAASVSLGPSSYGEVLAAPDESASAAPTPVGTSSSAPDSPLSLNIQLGSPTASGSARENVFRWSEVMWQADAAAALASTIDPAIDAFQITEPDGSTPAGAANFMRGSVRGNPTNSAIDEPSLDTISPAIASRQMQSNISALTAAMEPGAITAATVDTTPFGNSSDQFLVDVKVSLDSVADLEGFYGDLVDGLQTGLVGGGDSLVEGLEVQVSVNGQPELGVWTDPRGGLGALQLDPSLTPPDAYVPTATYKDLTNGPSTSSSVVGAQASITPAKRRSLASAQKSARSSNHGHSWLVWFALILLAAGAAIQYWRSRQPGRGNAVV
jgi:hypothetical protein